MKNNVLIAASLLLLLAFTQATQVQPALTIRDPLTGYYVYASDSKGTVAQINYDKLNGEQQAAMQQGKVVTISGKKYSPKPYTTFRIFNPLKGKYSDEVVQVDALSGADFYLDSQKQLVKAAKEQVTELWSGATDASGQNTAGGLQLYANEQYRPDNRLLIPSFSNPDFGNVGLVQSSANGRFYDRQCVEKNPDGTTKYDANNQPAWCGESASAQSIPAYKNEEGRPILGEKIPDLQKPDDSPARDGAEIKLADASAFRSCYAEAYAKYSEARKNANSDTSDAQACVLYRSCKTVKDSSEYQAKGCMQAFLDCQAAVRNYQSNVFYPLQETLSKEIASCLKEGEKYCVIDLSTDPDSVVGLNAFNLEKKPVLSSSGLSEQIYATAQTDFEKAKSKYSLASIQEGPFKITLAELQQTPEYRDCLQKNPGDKRTCFLQAKANPEAYASVRTKYALKKACCAHSKNANKKCGVEYSGSDEAFPAVKLALISPKVLKLPYDPVNLYQTRPDAASQHDEFDTIVDRMNSEFEKSKRMFSIRVLQTEKTAVKVQVKITDSNGKKVYEKTLDVDTLTRMLSKSNGLDRTGEGFDLKAKEFVFKWSGKQTFEVKQANQKKVTLYNFVPGTYTVSIEAFDSQGKSLQKLPVQTLSIESTGKLSVGPLWQCKGQYLRTRIAALTQFANVKARIKGNEAKVAEARQRIVALKQTLAELEKDASTTSLPEGDTPNTVQSEVRLMKDGVAACQKAMANPPKPRSIDDCTSAVQCIAQATFARDSSTSSEEPSAVDTCLSQNPACRFGYNEIRPRVLAELCKLKAKKTFMQVNYYALSYVAEQNKLSNLKSDEKDGLRYILDGLKMELALKNADCDAMAG